MRLAVLGDPVDHSLSPTIHQAALDAVGIPGSYEALRVDRGTMPAAVDEIRLGSLDGANVTMPHKQVAADLADRLEPTARRAGAVNTLVRVDHDVIGHNTDVAGVRTVWQWSGLPASGPVLILGAGGAGAAALLAMEDRPLFVAARRADAVEQLIAELDVSATVIPWAVAVGDATVVNATPLGMAGETLPSDVLAAASGLLEMAYGTGPTAAARVMAASGRPVASGPEMLLAQGAASFELWTGRRAPVAEMRAAMDAELERRARR